jgi:predicted site-specific integrase-resolvase
MARLLTEKEAAESIGLDLATFKNWVASGKLPKPIPDCGKYDLKALDKALDRLSGIETATNALDAWKAKGQHARTS